MIYYAYVNTRLSRHLLQSLLLITFPHMVRHQVNWRHCNPSVCGLLQISEAEKDHLRQELHMKIQKLYEMRQEAETLEKQLDRQSSELSEAQGELDQLQSLMHTLKPEDLRHVSKIAASDTVFCN